MDIALDSDDASSPVKKDVRQEEGMTNGGGATNGNVFDIAMEEMNQEEEENDEEDEAGNKEDEAKEEDADGAKEEDAEGANAKEEDAEGAKENGDDESKTDEGGEKSSPSSLKTKGAMKEVDGDGEGGPKDAFDDMLSGKSDSAAAKTTIPKDAFDSMLSPGADGDKEAEDGDKGGVDDTVLSVPDTPAPVPVVSSSEEEVETEVETEVEVEEPEPYNICTSMVGHMVAPPEDYEPKMVKKTVKKLVKRTVKRKKGRKTRGGRKGGLITIDDDEPLNKWAANIPSNEEYFEQKVDPEAIEWFKEHGPKIETAGDSGLKCTTCFKAVSMALNTAGGMWRHAILGVGVCKKCRDFYKDGEGWDKDDEGLDIFCRWCGQGGEILLCDSCPKAFCRTCIQRNLGRQKLAEITSSEEWKCLCCDPKQLYEKQALFWAVWQRYKSGNYKKPSDIKKEKEKQKKEAAKKAATEKQKRGARLVKDPKNFVDENLSEAFKTLNVYQKCLEQERDRWVKSGQQLNVNSATAVCRALRKIYAITKQNMDLLDKAVVQSFVENFPRDSTRIHMGKVGIKVKEGNLTGKPTKIKPGMKVKLKTPAPKPKKKRSFVLNGSPVYADPDEVGFGSSSSRGGRGRPRGGGGRPGPKSATKKRRYSSDDDIVVLDDSDPEPGPSSGAKRRPGPASKTMRR